MTRCFLKLPHETKGATVKPKRKWPSNSHLPRIQREGRYRYIARLMLLGLDQERIALRCHCTARNLRYIISTPEFELICSELQRERDQRMARLVKAMDDTAVKVLARLLTNDDPRIQLAAIEHLHSIRRTALVEKREAPTGGDESLSERQLDNMSPQQRDAWREATRKYLEVTRDVRRPRTYGLPEADAARPEPPSDRRAMWGSDQHGRTMNDQNQKLKPPRSERRDLGGLV